MSVVQSCAWMCDVCMRVYADRETRCPWCGTAMSFYSVARSVFENSKSAQKRMTAHALVNQSHALAGGVDISADDQGEVVDDGEARVGPQSIMDIDDKPLERIETGHDAIDLVTGGGFVRGKLYGFHGPEGSGKSRLSLMAAAHMCRAGNVAYCTASMEESGGEVRRHASEAGFLKMPHVKRRLTVIEKADNIEQVIEELTAVQPVFTVVDSASVLQSTECLRSEQKKHAARKLRKFAQETNSVVLALFHLNNDGVMGGGRDLRYLVDAILQMELMQVLGNKLVVSTDGEPTSLVRFRSGKNRYAAPTSVALFELTDVGLKTRGKTDNYGGQDA